MTALQEAGRAGGVTYEGVQRGVRGDPPHLVDGFEGEDVLVVVGAPQRAAGAAAGAQVTRRKGCRSTWINHNMWSIS